METQERLRVYSGMSGHLLLDVSAEECDWPEESDRIFTVSDVLHFMRMDHV